MLTAYAQRTNRLNQLVVLLAENLSANLAAKLLKKLKMPVSSDTLIRLVKKPAPAPKTTPPLKIIGVDDFAFRRGKNYGTVIVDLERGQPIELLPDRTAPTLPRWLKQHSTVEIVTRDRSTEYARGITDGTPTAVQVADRWHILKNWREVIERSIAPGPASTDGSVSSPLPF